MRSASATEVPPNFCTTSDMGHKATGAPRGPGPTKRQATPVAGAGATTLIPRVHREASTPEGRPSGPAGCGTEVSEAEAERPANHHHHHRGCRRIRHLLRHLQALQVVEGRHHLVH